MPAVRTPARVTELLEKYPEPENLLAVYNPAMQVRFTHDLQRAYLGNAPSIGLVRRAYGEEVAELWLECQINDLAEFAGVKTKIRPDVMETMAAMMMEDYGHYKLTEWMHFFQKMKRCQYGPFFGSVDPMLIFGALREFDRERADLLARYEADRGRERRNAAIDEDEALRADYKRRVPFAGTAKAPLTLLQFRLMGYSCMDDEQLAAEIEALQSGRKKIPQGAMDILRILQSNRMVE